MDPRQGSWLAFLRALLRVLTVFAVLGLIADFGLPIEDSARAAIRLGQLALVGLFALHTSLAFAWAEDRRAHFGRRWLEIALLAVIFADVLVGLAYERRGPLAGAWFFGVQAYLVARLGLTLAHAQEWLSRRAFRPALWLFLTFAGLAFAGACLLLLPRSRADGVAPWTFTDAFFTATSAVCVTGLSVRDVGSELSFRGQALLLGLIQLGGLGLVVIACGVGLLERGRLSMRESRVLSEAVGFSTPGRLRQFLVFAVTFTLVVELLGATALWFAVEGHDLGAHDRVWWSVFHAVSAFCNAGFGLSASNLAAFAGDARVLGIIATLIVTGGLGFAVHMDLLALRPLSLGTLRFVRWRLAERMRWPWRNTVFQGPTPHRSSLTTRLVLVTSALLVIGGTVALLLAESRGVFQAAPVDQQWACSAFASVSARTAGFQTTDLSVLSGPALLVTMLLMAVGASPLSTGGGVKTSTLAVATLTLRAMTRDRAEVEAFGRTIPRHVVNACVAVVALYASLVVIVTTALLATQEGLRFEGAAFESISALSTVGLSLNVTTTLDDTGRWIVAMAMIAGRVGPLACLWTFVSRGRALRYRYPDESVVVS